MSYFISCCTYGELSDTDVGVKAQSVQAFVKQKKVRNWLFWEKLKDEEPRRVKAEKQRPEEKQMGSRKVQLE